jgi:glycine cleavage system H protein
VGRKVVQSEAVAVVESVKAASDVFSPIAGEVTEVNGDLTGQPALVNEDAEGKAWFFKIKVADAAELDALMDRAAYEAFVKESS